MFFMLKCPICNKELKYINNKHLKMHNLTPIEFKVMYPDINNINSDTRQLMSNNGGLGAMANKKKIREISRKI